MLIKTVRVYNIKFKITCVAIYIIFKEFDCLTELLQFKVNSKNNKERKKKATKLIIIIII